MTIMMMVGGTSMTHALTVQITARTFSGGRDFVNNGFAEVQFLSNGTLQEFASTSNGFDASISYGPAEWRVTGNPSTAEVRVVASPDSSLSGSMSGSARNTWLPLSSNRTFRWTSSDLLTTGFTDLTCELRKQGSVVTLDTAIIRLQVV